MIELSVQLFLVLLATTLLTGFCEELVVRGIAQDTLKPFGPRLSLILSTLIFSGSHYHGGISAVVIAFPIGLAFALAKFHTGQLWPLMLAHFMMNLTSDLYENKWPHFGHVAALLLWIYCIVGAYILWRSNEEASNGVEVSRSSAYRQEAASPRDADS